MKTWIFLFFILPQIFWLGFSDSFYEIKRIVALISVSIFAIILPKLVEIPRTLSLLIFSVFFVKYSLNLLFNLSVITTYSIFLDSIFLIFAFVLYYKWDESFTKQFFKIGAWSAGFFSLLAILQNLMPRTLDLHGWTFGNANMFSEWILLTVPFLFYGFWHAKNKVCLAFLCLSVLAIVLLQSRSSILALIVMGISEVIFLLRSSTKVTKLFLVAAISVLALIFGSVMYEIQKTAPKTGSTAYRLQLQKDTLALIKNHPYGVGIGQFEFSLNPHKQNINDNDLWANSKVLDRNPHNEFLKWTAENGWAFMVFCLIIACWIVFIAYRNSWTLIPVPKQRFFVYFFISVLIQSLFQFPFENAASSLLISAVLSMFVYENSKHFDSKIKVRTIWVKMFSVLCFVFSIVFFSTEFTFSFLRQDLPAAKFWCVVNPLNWKNCKNVISGYIEKEDYHEAYCASSVEIARRPLNYYAILSASQSLINLGKVTEGCAIGYQYYSLFPNELISLEVKKFCELNSAWHNLHDNTKAKSMTKNVLAATDQYFMCNLY